MACANLTGLPGRRWRAARILVAEDHPVNQLLVRRILEKQGMSVVVAADGELALSIWRADPSLFDLILMDVQMPNLDGLEAARQIRRDEAGRSTYTPIVALTAHSMRGDEERCLAAGMDAYLSKPIEKARLLSTLQHFLKPGESLSRAAPL